MAEPWFTHCEDGSTLIEWVFEGARFGISLEPGPDESSWYLVSNEVHGSLSEFGYLPPWLKVEVVGDEKTGIADN